METIKSFTSIEQSRKLAEILPLESADMHYNDWNYDFHDGFEHTGIYVADLGTPDTICGELDTPCWSLAALLEILQYPILFHNGDKEWGCTVWIDTTKPYSISPKDNPIDACYEMIMRLHELKML